MRWRDQVVVFAVAVLAAACGSSAPSAPSAPAADAGVAATAGSLAGSGTTYAAPHPSLPLIDYNGGPILKTPKMVTVTFAGDPLAAEIDAFSDAIGGTHWWQEVTRGYCTPGGDCVGALTHDKSSVVAALEHDLTVSGFDDGGNEDSSIKQLLRDEITSGAVPAPTGDTIYLVYLPEGVPMRDYDAYRGCHDFWAYHSSMRLGAPGDDAGSDVKVPYIVVPRCVSESITELSRAVSHELVETAVDPMTDDHAFYLADTVWPAFFGGNEPADLCTDVFGQLDTIVESGLALQRVWSNAAVKEGTDPCVPAPAGSLYFNTAPPTDLVRLEIGNTTTIEIDGFSQGPIDDWQIDAVDLFEQEGIGQFLDLRVDDKHMNNGTHRVLTIHMIHAAPPGSPVGAPILLRSTSGDGRTHLWPIAVIGPN